MLLNKENCFSGYLIDDELMAGVCKNKELPEVFDAFVISHLTGETLAYHQFSSLDAALQSVASTPRNWAFYPFGKCKGGNCKDGPCKTGKNVCEAGKCLPGEVCKSH